MAGNPYKDDHPVWKCKWCREAVQQPCEHETDSKKCANMTDKHKAVTGVFPIGSKVTCIDADGRKELTEGMKYEVEGYYDSERLYLVGHSGHTPYKASRFIHEKGLQVDKTYCIHCNGLQDNPCQSLEWALGCERFPRGGKIEDPEPADIDLPVDNVNLPSHYARFEIEPVRFIVENKLNFMQGNIVKYVLRHDAKNGLEDVKKAQRYCQMLHDWLAGDPDWWKSKKPVKEWLWVVVQSNQKYCYTFWAKSHEEAVERMQKTQLKSYVELPGQRKVVNKIVTKVGANTFNVVPVFEDASRGEFRLQFFRTEETRNVEATP